MRCTNWVGTERRGQHERVSRQPRLYFDLPKTRERLVDEPQRCTGKLSVRLEARHNDVDITYHCDQCGDIPASNGLPPDLHSFQTWVSSLMDLVDKPAPEQVTYINHKKFRHLRPSDIRFKIIDLPEDISKLGS